MNEGSPEVVATLEDDTGDRCVDILRHDGGHFTFVELHRTDDTTDQWQQVADPDARTYKTQFAAYTAATRTVDWLMD